MAPDVENALITLSGTIISAALSALAMYAKKHWAVLNDATMNAAIASFSERLAPFVVKELEKIGTHPDAVTTGDPIIAKYARTVIASYPEFSKSLGLSIPRAAEFVLSSATKYNDMKGGASPSGQISPVLATPLPSSDVVPPNSLPDAGKRLSLQSDVPTTSTEPPIGIKPPQENPKPNAPPPFPKR